MSKNVLDIESMKIYKFLTGNLYLSRSNSKKLLLANAGDILTKSEIDKFKSYGNKISLEEVVSVENINHTVELLNELEQSLTEIEELNWRTKFLFWIQKEYLNEKGRGHFLELVIALRMKLLSLEDEESFINSSCLVYTRSSSVAAAIAIGAITIGITDLDLIGTLYNSSLLFDYDLIKDGVNYTTFNLAIDEHEQGLDSISKIYSKDMIEKYLSHVDATVPIGKVVHRLIRIHHERIDGTGFPDGLVQEELSDLEEIVVLANRVIPYKNWTSSESLTSNIISRMFDKQNSDCRASLVLARIINTLETVNYEVIFKDVS